MFIEAYRRLGRSFNATAFRRTFPELVDGGSSGLWSNVEQNADIGLDQGAKGVEEPAMTVEFLLVLFLETENDLNGASASGDLASIGYDDLRGVLEDMCSDILSVDRVLGNTLLVAAHQIKDFEGALVDLASSIGDDANDDLLPTVWTPHFRPCTTA
jgi:hypothetical protein